jgi:hypothetical protein
MIRLTTIFTIQPSDEMSEARMSFGTQAVLRRLASWQKEFVSGHGNRGRVIDPPRQPALCRGGLQRRHPWLRDDNEPTQRLQTRFSDFSERSPQSSTFPFKENTVTINEIMTLIRDNVAWVHNR